MGKRAKTAWIWLGAGCLGVVVVALAVIAAVVVVGARTAATMADPQASASEALDVLSADRIPDGYRLKLVMSVPLVPDFVVLEGDAGQVVYLGDPRGDLAAVFEDDDRFDAEVHRAGVRAPEGRLELARGAFRHGDADVRYVLADGPLILDADADAAGFSILDFDLADIANSPETDDGSIRRSAIFVVRCPDDPRPGLGLWNGLSAAAGRTGPVAETDAGPGEIDRAALVDLIEQFGFCASPG